MSSIQSKIIRHAEDENKMHKQKKNQSVETPRNDTGDRIIRQAKFFITL